jgi:SecD/SecF fusion protein
VEILRRRVDKYGVAEPSIQKSGTDRIEIQMPGLTDAEKNEVKQQIERAAFLEFRMVHPENARLSGRRPDSRRLRDPDRGAPGSGRFHFLDPMLVKKKPERRTDRQVHHPRGCDSGPDDRRAQDRVRVQQRGCPPLLRDHPRWSPREGGPGGTQYFRMAIVLDGVLYSAPRILGEIPGGRGVITGFSTFKEAFELANVLMNPLEAPVKIIEENSVAATLGADSIASGVRATLIGTASSWGSCWPTTCWAASSPTWPAPEHFHPARGDVLGGHHADPARHRGIVLTAGMAVDANVLIFERIREELAAGKSLRGALNAGYGKVFWTIFDSNLTTLISAVIMIWLGTGPVKGFGVTLAIGLCVSMFTALVVTRLIFDFLIGRGILTDFKMMSLIKPTQIDFMKLAKPAFALSWILILIGIGYGIYRGKDVLGVDFSGGDSVTFSYQQKVPSPKFAMPSPNRASPTLRSFRRPAPAAVCPRSRSLCRSARTANSALKVQKLIPDSFPNAGLSVKQVDRKGPTVGDEIQLSALKSLLLALFGILVYVAFRYEFSFSIGAVIAIIHDVLMTMGWFFLTDRQLSAPMVAAILTIVGFSINDTIVIFDRIREDLKLGIKGSFRDVMNLAINQTLSRTIITSGTVFLATLSLYVFGGSVINDFAFTFLVGMLTGTYSTIYIASAVVLWWHKGHRPVIGPVQSGAPQIPPPAPASA